VTWDAASAGARGNAGTPAAHAITAAGPTTVAGVYMVVSGASGNTDTTGVLLSAGDFAATRSVISGDTLNVTYSLSI
jgi:hypothetical protein